MNRWKCKYCGGLNEEMNNCCSNCGAAKIDDDNKKEIDKEQVIVTKDIMKEKSDDVKSDNKEPCEDESNDFLSNIEIAAMLILLIAFLTLPFWLTGIFSMITKHRVAETFAKEGYALMYCNTYGHDDDLACLVEDSDGNEYTMYVSKSVVSDTGYKIVDQSHLNPNFC